MPDGITLLANHYYPRNLGQRPTILIQSIYTNRTKGEFFSEIFVEQGFQVLIVSGRGACGSGGEMNPFVQEHDDGVYVLSWLNQQKWFDGRLGTTGGSYLGYTQWAIAHEAGPTLKAMSTQITSSDFRSMVYPGNAFSLEIFLGWLTMVDSMEKSTLIQTVNAIGGGKSRRKAAWHLPLVFNR